MSVTYSHEKDRYVDTDYEEELEYGEHIEDIEEEYEIWLDEVCEKVRIGNIEYLPSWVFKQIDPIAFNCGFSDWLDVEISEGRIVEHEEEYYRA